MWTGLTILQRASKPGPRDDVSWVWEYQETLTTAVYLALADNEYLESCHNVVCGLLRLKKIGDTDFPLGSQRHGGMLHDGVY